MCCFPQQLPSRLQRWKGNGAGSKRYDGSRWPQELSVTCAAGEVCPAVPRDRAEDFRPLLGFIRRRPLLPHQHHTVSFVHSIVMQLFSLSNQLILPSNFSTYWKLRWSVFIPVLTFVSVSAVCLLLEKVVFIESLRVLYCLIKMFVF